MTKKNPSSRQNYSIICFLIGTNTQNARFLYYATTSTAGPTWETKCVAWNILLLNPEEISVLLM